MFPLESRLPTVIEQPAAFATLVPVTPSKLCGVLNDAEVEGAPLNLTVSPVDLP